jgi:serine/threonine-protein kinase
MWKTPLSRDFIMPFSIGLQVGPYRILEQLGQGGMATVYKGYHASLDRYVAVKVLHQAFLEDPNFHARFQREARVVARLEHPNIVPIYDYAEHENQPYLVMKYIEGETLKARLQRGMLTASEVLTIVEAVGAGLAYAHKQGILHRDIKPSNVILASDGGIYLADFGLARIAQSGESTLTSDMVLGTPQYISPEQAMSKKDLDDGTDIYSFGVMLYEMTVGRVPFSADTPFSVIHDHIYTPLPLPTSVNPKVSIELERVLLKALAKERADRFKDVPEFVEAFKLAWMNSASTMAVPTPTPGPEASTLPPLVSSPLTMPAAPGAESPSAPVPAAVTDTGSQPGKKKSGKRWWWAASVAGICLCCVTFLAIGAYYSDDSEDVNISRGAVETLLAEVATEVITQLPPEQPAPDLEPVQVELPALGLEAAQQSVYERPDDPLAHIQLGVALVRNERPMEGYDEIWLASELAANDRPLLIGAGLALERNQFPLGAAILYLHAAEKTRPNAPGMDFLADSIRRSVYFGFADPLAPEVLDYAILEQVNESLALVAQVRYAIINNPDDFNATQEIINNLRRDQPGLAEIELLQAELLIAEFKPDQARTILQDFIQRPNIPPWITQRANELLSKLP